MSNLSKETLARIEKDAEVYGEEHQDHLYNVKGYSTYNDLVSGYNAGALHEAERAQGLVDALEAISDKVFKRHIQDGNNPLANELRNEALEALAKYKEVNA
jgi:hypothetical protein